MFVLRWRKVELCKDGRDVFLHRPSADDQCCRDCKIRRALPLAHEYFLARGDELGELLVDGVVEHGRL